MVNVQQDIRKRPSDLGLEARTGQFARLALQWRSTMLTIIVLIKETTAFRCKLLILKKPITENSIIQCLTLASKRTQNSLWQTLPAQVAMTSVGPISVSLSPKTVLWIWLQRIFLSLSSRITYTRHHLMERFLSLPTLIKHLTCPSFPSKPHRESPLVTKAMSSLCW